MKKEGHSVATQLEGALLISTSTFPYFMLVAFEAGGPVRALIMLLMSPVVCLLEWFCCEKLAIQLMIFISMLGLKAGDVKAVGKSVLPRFYLEDIRASAFKALSGCGRRKYVVTSMPIIMVECFLKDYLNVDCVIGAKLRVVGGYCIGLTVKPEIHIQERVIVLADDEVRLLRDDYPKKLIFHDGRLVPRPTPLESLAICMWFPLGILLAILRAMIGLLLPYEFQAVTAAATGVKTSLGLPPSRIACAQHMPYSRSRCVTCDPGIYRKGKYTLYASSHRTVIDPLIIAAALEQPVTAVTYSISKISELLAPIKTVRLSRDRSKDKEAMHDILKRGNLIVCPEGTTCREPYLLRFSPLFAEIADDIVPVAVETKSSMFYGNTARGYKWLDPLFFLMNPNPEYKIQFLERVSGARTDGKSSQEVANIVQKLIGDALGFQCTNFSRKDKYMILAGNDGRVMRREL